MTSPFLTGDIARDEGCGWVAYRDTVGIWTIGFGHTGPEVVEGLTWTDQQCRDQLEADIARVEAELDAHLPWWRSLNDARQDVLANMAFNLGVGGLMGFKHTLEAIQGGSFGLASAGMLGSKWASQVGDRARRLADIMESGVR